MRARGLAPGARGLTRRQRRAAVILLLVAVLFIGADVAMAPFRDARGGASGLLGSLARGTDSVVGPARRLVQQIGPGAADDRSRIEDLEAQNAQLRQQLAQAQVDQSRAQQLAALQLQAAPTGMPVLPARVIGTGPGQGFEWTVLLDVSAADGVVVGQTVIAGGGLVGRIVEVRGSSATALLIADPGSGVGVRDERTGQLGVLSGNGTASLRFVPLDPSADVQAGDQLLSGPAGSSTYVADLPVGVIRSVSTAANGARLAVADPVVSLTALDVVGVLLDGGASAGSDAPRQPLAGVPSGDGGG